MSYASVDVHYISTLEISTKQGGDTKWLALSAYDAKGEKQIEITLYAYDGKNVTLKLGEKE